MLAPLGLSITQTPALPILVKTTSFIVTFHINPYSCSDIPYKTHTHVVIFLIKPIVQYRQHL